MQFVPTPALYSTFDQTDFCAKHQSVPKLFSALSGSHPVTSMPYVPSVATGTSESAPLTVSPDAPRFASPIISRRGENHWLRSFSFSLACSISVLHEQVIKPRPSPDCPNEFDQVHMVVYLTDPWFFCVAAALSHTTTHVCRVSDRRSC